MNWVFFCIVIGIVGGGLFGFYVMYKVENYYKVRNMNLYVVLVKYKFIM